MSSDTLTLALDGNVSLRTFAVVVEHFRGLIDALSSEVSGDTPIEWVLSGLQYGSMATTFRGHADKPEYVERVTRAYVRTGAALQGSEPFSFSERVRKEARAIAAVLGNEITSIRFETADEDATVYRSVAMPLPRVTNTKTYGAIEGRVQTLTERGELRFTLYESLTDKAVSCYLSPSQRDMMIGAWGKRAIVEGIISRDPVTGRPTVIRQITDIVIIEDEPSGTFRQARGIAPIGPNDLRPDEAIRRVREGYDSEMRPTQDVQ